MPLAPAGQHRYERPTALADALALLANGAFEVLAGGTDLLAASADRPPSQPWLDISALEALSGLSTVSGTSAALRIGALTTWNTLARTPLPPGCEALAQAAREVGGAQIQNRGTLGGNLCNAAPGADGIAPLLALDAQVELASQRGTRRLPLTTFLQGNHRTARRPDELVTGVLVPFRSQRATSRFLKLGARRHLARSIAMVAVALDFDARDQVTHCGIAVGACAAAARRLPPLETALRLTSRGTLVTALERLLDADNGASALAALAPIDDLRGSATYRLDAVATMIRRAVAEIAADRNGAT
jgi:CO/xanthine dehydrogenase FAD-binding subunit